MDRGAQSREQTSVVAVAPEATRPVAWLHEFLLAFNVAWMAVWHERVRYGLRWMYSSPLVEYPYWHTRHAEPETVYVQVLWSIVCALLVFLLVQLLTQVPAIRLMVRTLGGAFAIAAFPLFALYSSGSYYPQRIQSHGVWLIVETMAIVGCAILYYRRIWPLRSPLSILLMLLLHFSCLAWLTGNYINPFQEIEAYGLWSVGILISSAFYLGFPVIGFLSGLTWVIYVRGLAHTFPCDNS